METGFLSSVGSHTHTVQHHLFTRYVQHAKEDGVSQRKTLKELSSDLVVQECSEEHSGRGSDTDRWEQFTLRK